MDETKFKRSCLAFRQAMYNETTKRRKTILLKDSRERVKVTSVIKLPRLQLPELRRHTSKKSDILERLVKELGIDQEGEEENANNARSQLIREALTKIEPIAPGKHTRFRRTFNSVSVTIYIRCSLDIWLVIAEEKYIFPKPRNDLAVE